MGEVRLSTTEGTDRSTARSRHGAAFAVWYLRVVTFINFLSAVWVTLGQGLRRHNTDDYFTPYLLEAGFTSGVVTLFLAVTMRRRKRAAWILNMVLGGLFLLLFAYVMALPGFHRYAQNWISLALTTAFVVALVVGRREFYAKGDRSNPLAAIVTAVGGLLVTSLIAAVLVSATNTYDGTDQPSFLHRWRYGLMRLVFLVPDDRHTQGITTPGWVNVIINVLATLLLIAVIYAAFRNRRAVDPLHRRGRGEAARAAGQAGRARLARLLRAAPRQGRDLVADRQGGGHLPRGRRRLAGLRRPDRRPRGVARRHRAVAGRGPRARLDPGGRPGRARRRGRSTPGTAWTPWRLGDEAIVEIAEFTLEGRAMRDRAPGVQPGQAGRVHGADPPPRGHPGRGDGTNCCARPTTVARRRHRTRLLHGARPTRRPADGRCVMLECHDGEGRVARRCSASCPGAPRASRWI